ncbi:MAG: hypothetical protein ACJAVK_001431 [Akkermansiaceae bacterium]|jgi:hypothetical protein
MAVCRRGHLGFFYQVVLFVSLGAMNWEITMLPLKLWVKGPFPRGLFFLLNSTISVSKTLHNKHQSQKKRTLPCCKTFLTKAIDGIRSRFSLP